MVYEWCEGWLNDGVVYFCGWRLGFLCIFIYLFLKRISVVKWDEKWNFEAFGEQMWCREINFGRWWDIKTVTKRSLGIDTVSLENAECECLDKRRRVTNGYCVACKWTIFEVSAATMRIEVHVCLHWNNSWAVRFELVEWSECQMRLGNRSCVKFVLEELC